MPKWVLKQDGIQRNGGYPGLSRGDKDEVQRSKGLFIKPLRLDKKYIAFDI